LFDDIASFPAPTVLCRYRNYWVIRLFKMRFIM